MPDQSPAGGDHLPHASTEADARIAAALEAALACGDDQADGDDDDPDDGEDGAAGALVPVR